MAGLTAESAEDLVALDTNVLVRCLAADDAAQTPLAMRMLSHPGGAFIGLTVLLETEWVLRAAYGLGRDAIHRGLLGVCGLPQVQIENAEQAARALDDFARGMDFADALHLAAAERAGATLYTFDAQLVKSGKRLGRAVARITP